MAQNYGNHFGHPDPSTNPFSEYPQNVPSNPFSEMAATLSGNNAHFQGSNNMNFYHPGGQMTAENLYQNNNPGSFMGGNDHQGNDGNFVGGNYNQGTGGYNGADNSGYQGNTYNGGDNSGFQGKGYNNNSYGGYAGNENSGNSFTENHQFPNQALPESNHNNVPSTTNETSSSFVGSGSAPTNESFGDQASKFFSNALHSMTLTKRSFMERLGFVDSEVPDDTRDVINSLQVINGQYAKLAFLAKSLCSQFDSYVEAQRQFGEFLYESGTKETTSVGLLMAEVGQMHRVLDKQNKGLVDSLHALMGLIDTFRTAVVDDALSSLQKSEKARIEWLTFQDGLKNQMRSTNAGEAHTATVIVNNAKDNYNKIREDLATKVVLLNEKRIQELSTQLISLAKAWSVYYSNYDESMKTATTQLSSDPQQELKELLAL